MTRYREAHDYEGEIWVALDGRKIYGASFYGLVGAADELLKGEPDRVPAWAKPEVNDRLAAAGITDQHALMRALFLSLSQSIEDMLNSPHPLIRGMAILDKRCGKRRLTALPLEGEHELVRQLAVLRSGTV